MTTSREIEQMRRLVAIIQNYGMVTKVRLVRESRISISYYEKLKPFIEDMFSKMVRYDKASKTWQVITETEGSQVSASGKDPIL